MAIPESQLVAWSGVGAQQGSARTYQAIRSALDKHSWPPQMNHAVYLQGSYRNSTNICGDSDVDVAVESSNVFYHNIPWDLRRQYGLSGTPAYRWEDFRDQVRLALVNSFGSAVSDRNKCIKVSGSGTRLNADVVPCTTYRYYRSGTYTEGITFWTRGGTQIINFSKAHLENGSQKNRVCGDRYKPNVRVCKNARNAAGNDFPSYFLECLLYNVPSRYFRGNFQETFPMILSFLQSAYEQGNMSQFQCQNEVQAIFGAEAHQTSLEAARGLLRSLTHLWAHGT